jgi:membrane protease YdiL (CAAX protease family)
MKLALPLFWVACTIAAYLYSLQRGIPLATAAAAFPAFLLEATLFLSLGSEQVRARLEKLQPWVTALLLTVAAVVPYCVASLALRSFDPRALGWLALLAAAASFWFVGLPHKAPAEILFLVFVGVVAFSKFLQMQYADPDPKLPLGALGQLMWIRTNAFVLLCVRRVPGVGFGFWPEARHWKIGALYFLAFLPVAALAVWGTGFGFPHLPAAGWERVPALAVGTFFGILWVVALGEEFFFRGLLQQWIGAWLGGEWIGLAVASLLFGAVHLWFRRFPEWRLAVLAAVAGVFYGLAFRHARSIRASMVTHALTVTTWRVFFS